LVSLLGCPLEEHHGSLDLLIDSIHSLEEATTGSISFLQERRLLSALTTTSAAAVLISPDLVEKVPCGYTGTLLVTAQPMQEFMQLLQMFKPVRASSLSGISPLAIISPTAKIGINCTIGPHAVIEDDVEVGAYSYIGSGVSIGAGSLIGEGTTLYARVVVYPESIIGKHVIIHAGAVIGADGFGFRFQHGEFQKLPHHGRVRIEDHVEIGANSTIDRAMIEETVIGRGTKIDNLVMIAHNCHIGQHNVLAAQVGIAGSTKVGNYSQFGGQAGVADHLTIGDQCVIAGCAGVHKNIPSGETQIGSPAGNVKEQRKIMMTMQRLPDIRDKVRQLEKDVKNMLSQIASTQTSTTNTVQGRAA
jgi:UDP-3-O-[3-hydroxymyristoyl] glucosamine N-acyltransferase